MNYRKRWGYMGREHVTGTFPKVDAFLEEIEQVCRKHGLSIGHEDEHGAFVVRPIDDEHVDWLRSAAVKDVPQ